MGQEEGTSEGMREVEGGPQQPYPQLFPDYSPALVPKPQSPEVSGSYLFFPPLVS